MVRSENGPISCEIVKVVHDDSNKQVQDEERANHKERDEIGISKVCSTTCGVIGVLAVQVAQDIFKDIKVFH